MVTTPEGKIKERIKKLLESYGEKCYMFMPVQMGFGKRTVDYLVCFDGLFVGIEAKKPNGKATRLQEAAMADIRGAGGSTFVVRDDDSLEHLRKFFDQMLNDYPGDQRERGDDD